MTAEACPERRDDLVGLVAGWLTADEAAEVRAHVAGCARCSAVVAELEATAVTARRAVVAALGPDEAPVPGLEQRVLARLAAERQTATADGRPDVDRPVVVARPVAVERAPAVEGWGGVEPSSRPRHVAPRRSRWPAVAAVAAGLAAAAGLVVAVQVVRDGGDDLDGESVALATVPEGSEIDAVLAQRGRATLIELTADGLDPDVVYELWLAPPKGGWEDRIPAGTFQPDDDGSVDVRLWSGMPFARDVRVWATAEGEIAFDTEPPRQR